MNHPPQFHDTDLSRQNPREQLVEGLRRQLGHWEATGAVEDTVVFSCGVAAIDRLLPDGGLRHGMLVEWLSGSSTSVGSGATTLGLLGAREACGEGGTLVVIDRSQTFYPPAVAAWGVDLDRLIVVHPQNARDELWAAVQALRLPAVAAMFFAIDRLDSRAFQRLQLAAQAGRTLGVVMRPADAYEQPSWADVRLEVGNCELRISDFGVIPNPQSPIRNRPARRVRVRVLRCHPGRAGGSAVLEIDDATYTVREASSSYDAHPLSVVSELGDSTGHSWSARA